MPRTPSPVQEISRAAIHKRAQRAVPANGARCCKCGSKNWLQRHHEDYSKPTDVTFLCAACHRKEHTLQPVNCLICGTAFQPKKTRRSTLCGNQECLKTMGRLSAEKRWKTGRTD